MVNYWSAKIPLSKIGSRSRRIEAQPRLHEATNQKSPAPLWPCPALHGASSPGVGLTNWLVVEPTPNWKICSSKWLHLPQFSGWKKTIFELPPPQPTVHHVAPKETTLPPPLAGNLWPPVGDSPKESSVWHPGRKVVNLHPVYSTIGSMGRGCIFILQLPNKSTIHVL